MKTRCTLIFLFCFLLTLSFASPTRAAAPLPSLTLLEKLIRFDTTNPPGNETVAMKWVQNYLENFGIESQLIESAPGRGNLIARLPKNTKEPSTEDPLMLLAHLDVVPADAAEWDTDPFEPTIKDGYLYGRGAIDMKAQAALMIHTLVRLKLQAAPLHQDILLVLVADEEAGGTYGAKYLVNKHWPEIKPAAVMNEGSIGVKWPLKEKTLHLYPIQVAEKGVAWLRLAAHGGSGHGSMPTLNNATLRLIRAVHQLTQKAPPIQETAIVKDMLKTLSVHFSFPDSWVLKYFFSFPVKQSLAWFGEARIQANPIFNAMLRNTITPTVLKADTKTNVIPATAVAELDCRLLPGVDPKVFRRDVEEKINDPQVSVELITASAANESSFHSPYYQALAEAIKQNDDQAVIIPYLSPGVTDNRFFREKGVSAFGIIPLLVGLQDIDGLHGKNERIPTKELARGEKILWDFVLNLQKRPH